ncbi:hypothetical protein [Mycobacterium helveticum]|jgi:pimeloyl-ACP methyl ester carboxylesterase|uniref:hypothetical protein n=1 Tax=Mycobacterium helveticum TaxID=2592811 RepID=UPI00143CF373|nr:hypothetical protein [Mycobacterium helveticum]
MVTMPALDGVEHRLVDLPGGVVIHVAGVGHWIVEHAPGLVLDRLRTFLRGDRET